MHDLDITSPDLAINSRPAHPPNITFQCMSPDVQRSKQSGKYSPVERCIQPPHTPTPIRKSCSLRKNPQLKREIAEHGDDVRLYASPDAQTYRDNTRQRSNWTGFAQECWTSDLSSMVAVHGAYRVDCQTRGTCGPVDHAPCSMLHAPEPKVPRSKIRW